MCKKIFNCFFQTQTINFLNRGININLIDNFLIPLENIFQQDFMLFKAYFGLNSKIIIKVIIIL